MSPRLGISFQLKEDTLEIDRPDGERFLTPVELEQLRLQEKPEKELAQAQAETERQRAEEAEAKAQRLPEKLWKMSIDPNQLD